MAAGEIAGTFLTLEVMVMMLHLEERVIRSEARPSESNAPRRSK